MALAIVLAATATLMAVAAEAAPVAGDWCGQLAPQPTAVLPLTLHLAHSADGGVTGALDSPAQGAQGMALAKVSASDAALAFEVPAVKGRYAGRWNVAGGAWDGQWTQGAKPLALSFRPAATAAPDRAPGLDGSWDGAVGVAAGMKLRLAVHIRSGPCGVAGGMDSIDQGAKGIPLADITRTQAKVTFTVPAVGGAFEGTLDAAADKIDGTWRQASVTTPLVLTRRPAGRGEATLDRPQTPKAPFPYSVRDVAFDDPAAGVRLAGAISLPHGTGPFPAVILIAGSGPQTRDEDVMGHKIFLVLADSLTRRGIAVLRYDKRGVGASTGVFVKATVQDFASDAQAAVDFLKTQPDIDPHRIGLVGHSEGGLIAPMVAARDADVAFLVLMAGPGVDGGRVIAEQQRLIGQAMGLSADKLAAAGADEARLIDIVRSQPQADAAKSIKAVAEDMARREGVSPQTAESAADQINSDWFRSFLAYDPAPTLARLRIPVLAVIGSKDLQVPPDQNLPALRAALAHDPRARVEELPGLNHLFQPATTGAPSEYQIIPTTMAPEALAIIGDWISATVSSKG